ncbi:MAG TPA: hypothetical protein VFT22_17065, partial [Kofleriaceae bacterium]|nr:hypothetical protein [Kofleriaceae bacterium]
TRGVARGTTGPRRRGVPSGSRGPTPARAEGRPTPSPFASRAQSASPTAYSSTAVHDGTNTASAMRPRAQRDSSAPRGDTGSPDTPPCGRARTPEAPVPIADEPSAHRTPSAPPVHQTRSPIAAVPLRAAAWPGAPVITADAATGASGATGTAREVTGERESAPITGRTDTEESLRFPETPTPSRVPPRARTTAATGAPYLARDRSPSSSGPWPALPRALTPNDADIRGFTDQRTPTGAASFTDQRTPTDAAGFADQRTPSAGASGPVTSRVSTDNAVAAEAAFKRGELAMKRDQPGEAILEFKAALDLNPNDVDYAGMLAWAKFCAAGDKAAIAVETRKLLERAVFKSHRPERARFYLGRVERMLGRDKEALRHFLEVLELKPNHADAASEVRAIEARLQAARGGTGLFGRKR